MDAPAHTRALMREVRRGLRTWGDGLFIWARAEPNPKHATLAVAVAKALIRISNAMAEWADDGTLVPGDSRTLTPGNRPPHDFT